MNHKYMIGNWVQWNGLPESLEDFWDEIQAHMYSDITYDKCDNGLLMYVHQAQNIYELLTQKELKFK